MKYILIVISIISVTLCQAYYAVIVDANSENTHLTVFMYDNLYESIKNIYTSTDMAPLSRYINYGTGKMNTTDLERDFRKLVDNSMRALPSENVPETNFFLLGRGDLRYLQSEYSLSMFSFLRNMMDVNYRMVSQPQRYMRILSVEEEAVFLWISVQYDQKNYKLHENSYGTVGMTKSTSNVAFIPTQEEILGDKTTTQLFGDVVQLYGNSFLRVGTSDTFQLSLEYLDPKTNENVTHPCLFLDSYIYDHTQKRYFLGSSDLKECRKLIREVLSWNIYPNRCYYSKCTINGDYLASIPMNQTFFAFGEFANILKGLKIARGPMAPQTVLDQASQFCDTRNFDWAMENSGFSDRQSVMAQCFDAMLGLGYLNDLLRIDLRSHVFNFVENSPNDLVEWQKGFLLFERQFEKQVIPEDVTEIYYKVSMICGFVFFGCAVCVNICLITVICFLCFKINAMKPNAEYVDLK